MNAETPPAIGEVAASGRTLGRKGRATRQRLLDASTAIFGSRQFDCVKVTDITTEADVASGTFYTYFASKEAVFREVAIAALTALRDSAAVPADLARADPLDAIEQSVRGFAAACARRRPILRSIEQQAATDPDVSEVRRTSRVSSTKVSHRFIEYLQRNGVTDPTLDAWAVAASLQAMTVSMVYEHVVWREPSDDAELNELLVTVTRVWAKALDLDDDRLGGRTHRPCTEPEGVRRMPLEGKC